MSDAPEVPAKAKSDDKKVVSAKAPKGKTTSTKKQGGDKEDKETKENKAEKEKEAEAPKSAKAETGGKGAIKVGDALPKITVQNEKGEDVKVGELGEGGRGVVLFLYPKVSVMCSLSIVSATKPSNHPRWGRNRSCP